MASGLLLPKFPDKNHKICNLLFRQSSIDKDVRILLVFHPVGNGLKYFLIGKTLNLLRSEIRSAQLLPCGGPASVIAMTAGALSLVSLFRLPSSSERKDQQRNGLHCDNCEFPFHGPSGRF